jgi:hypothetical protein
MHRTTNLQGDFALPMRCPLFFLVGWSGKGGKEVQQGEKDGGR